MTKAGIMNHDRPSGRRTGNLQFWDRHDDLPADRTGYTHKAKVCGVEMWGLLDFVLGPVWAWGMSVSSCSMCSVFASCLIGTTEVLYSPFYNSVIMFRSLILPASDSNKVYYNIIFILLEHCDIR